MADDDNALPLRGVILCGTSLDQEYRNLLNGVALEMGAVHKLDLTSDVTHLLVGSTNSDKYRHVARHRPDIVVLHPRWLSAVRDAWTDGGLVDLPSLDREHSLAALSELNICLTGFTDLKERQRIQASIESNGGTYHPDLTKSVSHLIVFRPTGAKYDRAKEWNIKLVSAKWLQDSLVRGMALDDSAYDPLLPIERQGQGAFQPRPRTSKSSKRKSAQLHDPADPNTKRKIRRTASTRLNSQSQTLWDDLNPVSDMDTPVLDDSWSQSIDGDKSVPHPTVDTQPVTETMKSRPSASTGASTSNPAANGIFSGWTCFAYGHAESRRQTLDKYLNENGAHVVESPADFADCEDLWTALVVPSEWMARPERLQTLPAHPPSTKMVTELWIERCLLQKKILDPDRDLYSQALLDLPADCFDGQVISSSGLGQDVRYVSRIVEAAGGQYEEFLTRKTTILLHNPAKADLDKPAYCVERGIDVVTPQWMHASLEKRQALPVTRFYLPESTCLAIRQIVDGRRKSAEAAQHLPGRTKHSDSFGDENQKGTKKSSGQRLTGVRRALTPALPLARIAPSRPDARPQSIGAQPLGEVASNSQERPRPARAASLQGQPEDDQCQSVAEDAPLDKENGVRLGAAGGCQSSEALSPSKTESGTRPVSAHANEVLSNILARRQASSTTTSQEAPKRKRTLGRASSGATVASLLSRSANSTFSTRLAATDHVSDEVAAVGRDIMENPYEAPQPSQQLSYEVDLAREQKAQMRRKGIDLNRGLGGTRIRHDEALRDADSGTRASVAGRVRGRHREHGEVVVEEP